MEASLEPFTEKTGIKVDVEVVGLGRAARPHPQRGRLGRGPGHHPGGHHAGAVLRRARRLRGPRRAASRTSAAPAPTPTGVWQTTQVVGQDGTWAVPWFTEARSIYYRKDVLEKAGVDPATAFADWDAFRATLQAIKDKVPGHPAVRHARQEGVRPRPPRDAVRVGRRRRGAVERQHASRRSTRPRRRRASTFFADLVTDGLADKSQLERDGTQVENQFKGGQIAVWIGGPWVLGVDRAHRRRELGPGGAQERRRWRRCRPARTATRSRSSAART